jgi:acetaldehyde dehydrogenase/alcohol dehydrogenase
LNIRFKNNEEGVEKLIGLIVSLLEKLHIPSSLSEAGVKKEEYEAKIKRLALAAYQDQTTTTNPRMPLISELEDIYRKAY